MHLDWLLSGEWITQGWLVGATLLEVAWLLGMPIWILLEHRSPQATLAWILGLSLLPVVGIPLYWVVGPRRFDRRKRRRARAQAWIRHTRPPSLDRRDEQLRPESIMMRMAETAAGPSAKPRLADVDLYVTGEPKYQALEEAIRQAQHHIHLEYYIWAPDRVGTRFRDLLAQRAREGVEVRVLVDAFGSSAASDKFWRPLRDAGAEVARFNAFIFNKLGRGWRPRMANFRSHRKIVVCDGWVGFTGGMNISEVHTAEFAGAAAWRDTHVRLEGPAVSGLQMLFCEDWHYATGSAPALGAYLSQVGATAETPTVQVVSSGPDENYNAIHRLFFSSIATAGTRVYLTSPYFVPDDTLLNALTTAALGGADVRVLVPSHGDVPFVAAASRSYYADLLQMGVRVFEYGTPVLHAKSLVVDDRLAMVGSANADNRSFRLNFEVAAVAYEPRATEVLTSQFLEDLKHATEITLQALERQSFFARLAQAFARLFSPLL